MSKILNTQFPRLPIRKRQFSLIVLFITVILNVAVALSQGSQTQSARFLVISDWGGNASENQKAVAGAMAKEAGRIHAQFILTAGDNYHKEGIDSATDPRWKTEYEDVYNQTSLRIPWYPSLGNHDYRGSVEAEIEYSKIFPRWKLSSRYYSHSEKIDDSTALLIIHLDTPPFIESYYKTSGYHVEGQDTKRQLVWLDSVLTVSHSRWTLVVGHHPLYSAASKHGNTKELIDQVLPILAKYHVPLYICGHDHILQHIKHDQTNFVICGGGSNYRDTDNRQDVVFGVGSLGFLSVTATAKDIHVNFINEKNENLYNFKISAEK